MPDDIAPGYRSEAELSPGTHRCVGPEGRTWVLKRLPDDCLHAGGLHPAIRERLARIRELPNARVATLAGVVRGTDPAAAFLVWAFVEGQPIDRAELSAGGFAAAARGLASAVETLHARGLVHGALNGGNVIRSPGGGVWLTHLSPYLWDDPAEDVRATIELLRPLADRLSLPVPDVSCWPAAAALRALTDGGFSPTTPAADRGRRHGRRSLMAAAGVAVAAAVAAAAIAAWAARSTTRPEADRPHPSEAPAR